MLKKPLRSPIGIKVLFNLVLFSPSFVMVAFSQTSMAAGLMLSAATILLFSLVKNRSLVNPYYRHEALLKVGFICALATGISLHAALAAHTLPSFDLPRFSFSLVAMGVVVAAAFILSRYIRDLRPNKLSQCVDLALLFLIFNALAGLTGVQAFTQMSHKPVGLFSEPSHFALVAAPLLIYSSATSAPKSHFYLLFFALWAVLIENLTTIVAVTIALIVTLRATPLRVAAGLIVFFLLFVTAIASGKYDYFFSRLNFTSESDNLSVLVLLQGWESALLLLQATSGWGAGFQQFGVTDTYGSVAERIQNLGISEQNRFDGGITAAKILGEFGFLSFIFFASYFALLFRSLFKIRQARRLRYPLRESSAFFYSCAIAFSMELFVRGIGYFSPGAFLYLVACFGVFDSRVEMSTTPPRDV